MSNPGFTNRRRFLQYLAFVGVGGRVLLKSGDARAAVDAAQQAAESPETWPKMPRRKLGRTGFEGSHLVFGCGAALSSRRRDDLLDTAFSAGVNVFDVGSSHFYADAEKNLAPFVAKHRDEILLISKAMVGLDVAPGDEINARQAEQAAATWSARLDISLQDLSVDKVDAYYIMAANNVSIIGSDEIARAFEDAKKAGKVDHLGLSTHQNAHAVLEKAMETGLFSLAQIAITPGGWYDLQDKAILKDSPPMTQLQPFLARVRESGIGLVGMKAGRYLAGRRFIGWANPDAFDSFYDEAYLKAPLSAFQRSYAFVLAHGVDSVNADMQSFEHLRQNFIAAATSAKYFS